MAAAAVLTGRAGWQEQKKEAEAVMSAVKAKVCTSLSLPHLFSLPPTPTPLPSCVPA